MKVLQVGSNSIHVSSFVEALNKHGIESYLLAEELCYFTGIKKEFHVSFRSLNPLHILKNNQQLKQILSDLRPDVIHIHQINRLAFFVSRAAEKLGIPVVTTAWGSDVLLIPQQNKFFKYLVSKTIGRSQICTADSKEMIDAMQNLESNGEFVLLQYGIEPVFAGTKERIIYSNRLHKPLYRIDEIIKYFADFLKIHQDWKLVVGAIGPELENLIAQTKELGISDNVEFVGWLDKDKNHSWYSRSMIYISIPESDGTSVSLLEAMSAGCIPIVSDLKVSREWIENGKNGIIEKDGANPIEEALKIDREEAVKINQGLVNEKVSRTSTIPVFISLYRKVIHG